MPSEIGAVTLPEPEAALVRTIVKSFWQPDLSREQVAAEVEDGSVPRYNATAEPGTNLASLTFRRSGSAGQHLGDCRAVSALWPLEASASVAIMGCFGWGIGSRGAGRRHSG
jgi:hypothetical protein